MNEYIGDTVSGSVPVAAGVTQVVCVTPAANCSLWDCPESEVTFRMT